MTPLACQRWRGRRDAWPLGDRRQRAELLEQFAPACPYPKQTCREVTP